MSEAFEKPPVLLTRADAFITWAQKNSLWPFGSGLACCAIEMIATAAARFDIARFGMELFRTYAVLQGVDRIIPVDVYIAGCPPTPQGLLHGLITLQEKIARSHPTR